MSKNKTRVAVIGCGLIGQRRAKCVDENSDSSLKYVVDTTAKVVQQLAQKYHCQWDTDWRKTVRNPDIDVVIVSTPNYLLSPIAVEAMKNGKHVLIEKPMGRKLEEARQICQVSKKYKRTLKIGFNHRYHPAIRKAYQLFVEDKIGKLINIRSQYGHGGRPGYEKEWRGNYKLCGGGELTDQGVHIIDLIQWFCGQPSEIVAYLQTAFWKIRPSEDNAFVLMKFENGAVANFHTSWTEWKNRFIFEIYGTKGFIQVHGLGGSYGPETLIVGQRRKEGGVPLITQEIFKGEDFSWKEEWKEFLTAISKNKSSFMGKAEEGLAVMNTLNAIYKSYRLNRTITLQ